MVTRETQARNSANQDSDFFLPDFCGLRVVFAVVILSELFAFVLTLSRPGSADPWSELALISLFVQWAGLSSAAVLCVSRRLLYRFSNMAAALISYLLLLTVILILSELSYWTLGDFLLEASTTGHLEFLLRNLAIGAIIAALAMRYFYVHNQWRRRIEAEGEARLQALQSRIRPHFLFNSMNTIASLISYRPEVAEEAVEDLADLFRASLATEQRLIPLEEELFLTRRYLHMEQLRLGDRLKVAWSLGDIDQRYPIPPLILQPLVENAVYHGIEPLPEGGTVEISATSVDGQLVFSISNPLSGEARRSHTRGNRIALENIRQRLHANYGELASLKMEQQGQRYTVRLTIPLQGDKA
jgi:two-component system sensor histidine kinase AlgZ